MIKRSGLLQVDRDLGLTVFALEHGLTVLNHAGSSSQVCFSSAAIRFLFLVDLSFWIEMHSKFLFTALAANAGSVFSLATRASSEPCAQVSAALANNPPVDQNGLALVDPDLAYVSKN